MPVIETKNLHVNPSGPLTFPGGNAYTVRKIAGDEVFWNDTEITEEGFTVSHDHEEDGNDYHVRGNGKIRVSSAEVGADPEALPGTVEEPEPEPEEDKPQVPGVDVSNPDWRYEDGA